MRVAVVHYHLRPGGVTRVIEHAVDAASGKAMFAVIAGERPPRKSPLAGSMCIVPEIGYPDSGRVADPSALSRRLAAAARDVLGAPPDVWHFHNHSLGKNSAINEALLLLSRESRLLLQVHDFAEDGRPALFRALLRGLGGGDIRELGRRLYPQAANIHYAALNSRDRGLLAAAGVPLSRLHLLPNPVVLPAADSVGSASELFDGDGRLFIYPTRAIRRKNIGEFLLWSAVAERGDRFAVTLAPENPIERPLYDEWVEFAGRLGLPVEFELGIRSHLPFTALLRRSHAVVTTSVAEGFGLAFLEPWLVGRPAIGRGLPDITGDFESAGVDLSHLYERLLVPILRNDRSGLLKKMRAALEKTRADYGRPGCARDAEEALRASMRGGRVDFGRLDEDLQRKVVSRALRSKSFRSELLPRGLMQGRVDWQRKASKNKVAIRRAFSPGRYAARLMKVYERVAASDIGKGEDCFDVNRLLDEFLAPSRFFLLRS